MNTSTPDRELREELERSQALLAKDQNSPLMRSIRQHLRGEDASLYLLDWIPEQAEDILVVLVGDSNVVEVELLRGNAEAPPLRFEATTLSEYRRGHKRMPKLKRRRLELAVALAREAASAS